MNTGASRPRSEAGEHKMTRLMTVRGISKYEINDQLQLN